MKLYFPLHVWLCILPTYALGLFVFFVWPGGVPESHVVPVFAALVACAALLGFAAGTQAGALQLFVRTVRARL